MNGSDCPIAGKSCPPSFTESLIPRAPTAPASRAGASVIYLRNVLTPAEFVSHRAVGPTIYTAAQVAHLTTSPRKLSDCGTAPQHRIDIVRNEEAGGSNPLSSTIPDTDRPLAH